jgi:MYXO-CTERM domain-containing protein
MTRRALLGSFGVLVAFSAACGDHAENTTGGGHQTPDEALLSEAVRDSPEAVVDRILQRFRFATFEPIGSATEVLGPVLRPAEVEGFEREGAGLRPHLDPTALVGTRRLAGVTLPDRADAAFTVRDEATGLSLAVKLLDVNDAPAEVSGGYVVYHAAHTSGADVVHRVTHEGTEDYLAFEAAPTVPSVEYAIELGEGVAGLRLVERTLELLDEGGAPRLRMAPPFLVDIEGARHEATVALEGCAFDDDPSAPWQRPVTAAGARSCLVRVAWDGAPVIYPALLDPTWTTTGSLATGRQRHGAGVLGNGLVLATGGRTSSNLATASAELYDPNTGSWAATGAMTTARYWHTTTVLGTGWALVAGGSQGNSGQFLISAERYVPSTGLWITTGAMTTGRYVHTGTVLGNGKVLIAGGWGASGVKATAELYDAVSDSWTMTGAMAMPRRDHTATRLDDGRVLVAGGSEASASAELYDPVTASWSVTGPMVVTDRHAHIAGKLADGRVLAAGGLGANSYTNQAEIFNPASGSWTSTGSMTATGFRAAGAVLADGRVLSTGGTMAFPTPLAGVELYDPLVGSWAVGASMTNARLYHTASLLADGRVLVVGGNSPDGTSSELFGPGFGTPCASASECGGGFCVDGFCCDTACGNGDSGDCQACAASLTGGTDGICAAVGGGTCRMAKDACDVAEVCDGTSLACPADGFVADGTECDGGMGLCIGGVCNADGPSGSGGGATGSGGAATGSGGAAAGSSGGAPGFDGNAPASDGGCGCRVAGDDRRRSRPTSLALLGVVAVMLSRRRSTRVKRRALADPAAG